MSLKSIVLLSLFISIINIDLSAQKLIGKKKHLDQILENIVNFSSFYVNKEYDKLAACYSIDGKIFPNNTSIIEGRERIKNRWILPEGVSVSRHKIYPEEIVVKGKLAYDYGYYEGTTLKKDGTSSDWRGKYVIVWKKVSNDWLIYLDIWNRVNE